MLSHGLASKGIGNERIEKLSWVIIGIDASVDEGVELIQEDDSAFGATIHQMKIKEIIKHQKDQDRH